MDQIIIGTSRGLEMEMDENDMISNQPDLVAIGKKHNVPEDRLVRGVIFAEYIVNGENATNAYIYAFQCDKQKAQMSSANFRNSKWVQELIQYFRPDENTLYFGEIRQIIRKGMAIIDDPTSEDKDVISAMNALAKYVKVNKSSNDKEEELSSDATKLMTKLIDGISELSKNNKMIDGDGQIIDVPILQ